MKANEKRRIDACGLVISIAKNVSWMLSSKGCKPQHIYDGVMRCIAEAPTVDAVEVPPVKICDTAYFIINDKLYEAEICLISWSKFRKTGVINELRGEVQKGHTVSARFCDWGKTVFATKEEAEKALAERSGNG